LRADTINKQLRVTVTKHLVVDARATLTPHPAVADAVKGRLIRREPVLARRDGVGVMTAARSVAQQRVPAR
jgi:hypothetical protein